MARNKVHRGDVLTVAPGADVKSGDPVAIGKRVAVALTDIAGSTGETGPGAVEGVWKVPKATGTAHAKGDVVDFDKSTGKFTSIGTPATGDVTGALIVEEDAASGDTEVVGRLEAGTVN